MNIKYFWRIAFLLLGGLASCQALVNPPPPPATPTLLPAVRPTAPVETAVPTTIPPFLTSDSILPPPTLFDAGWDDREPFRAGLIDAEQATLTQLPGASIYHLAFQISADLTRVDGQMEIRYTNQEPNPLDAIYFHLFPNLLGGQIAVPDVLVNGTAVTPGLEKDNTILRVPLVEPLPPAEQVVIHLNFVTSVPVESGRNYGIFAYVDEVLALAHFYPMVAVYDDEGWNIEPAAEAGDVVYADTSFYLVRVTAPANQIIVTSGSQIDTKTIDEQQTIIAAAGPVRDFYLAASPDYQPISATVGQTRINSYATSQFEEGATAVLDAAAAALEIYSEHFGTYPFTELDLVNTPTLALGVEYPGMIAITNRIYDLNGSLGNTPNSIFLESTTAHEVGHQWFYSVVGNDQLDEPWLDESLTQYVTWLYFRDRYGGTAADGFYQSLESRWNRIEQADIPIGLPVSAYEEAEYSGIIYGRGPIFILQLAQTMGDENWDAFLRDYYNTYKWEIADSNGFQTLAESHCQCDLSTIFDEQLWGP